MSFLAKLPRFNGPGLHRTHWLIERLPRPDSLPKRCIKVVGSKGKGSVSALTAAVLQHLDPPVGLFTSPHLRRVNERIIVGGVPIENHELEAALNWFQAAQTQYTRVFPGDEITRFEALTAIALYCFAARGVRTAVFEAGIGGRLDPTRTVPGEVTALTSIELEHCELLGRSREEIALEKLEISRDRGIVVIGDVEPGLAARLDSYAQIRGLRFCYALRTTRANAPRFRDGRMIFNLAFDNVELDSLNLTLIGDHQISNARTATQLVRAWVELYGSSFSKQQVVDAIRTGFGTVVWPLRFECLGQLPTIYADVGHTVSSMAAVRQTIETYLTGRSILLVTGISVDKPASEMIDELLPVADEVISTAAHHKGRSAFEIDALVKARRAEIPRHVAPSVGDAMRLAKELAVQKRMTVVVAGGLFLAVEASEALAGRDPNALSFY
jgi:dihydrofolate synthase / folylpolyglutamate synthase